MIWKGNDTFKMEKGEPALRSCWECNGMHDRLKNTNFLHACLWCGRYWIFGKFLCNVKNLDKFMRKCGMKPGQSTWSIERPSGVVVMSFKVKSKGQEGERG